MNENIFSRTKYLVGEKAMELLEDSKVVVIGLGGVGSFAFETLVRAGIGSFTIIDHAVVDETNLNRQLLALDSTIGMKKTKVALKRAHEINPDVNIVCIDLFLDEGNMPECINEDTSYIVDAIDSVSSKIQLAEYAFEKSIPIISCMGTGNKLYPELLRIDDIFDTSVDPLARIMRSELRKRNIKSLEVVWSGEKPLIGGDDLPVNNEGKKVPASISYVPSAAGILMASRAVNRLTGNI